MFNSHEQHFISEKIRVEVAFQSKMWIYTQCFPTHGVLHRVKLAFDSPTNCFLLQFWDTCDTSL